MDNGFTAFLAFVVAVVASSAAVSIARRKGRSRAWAFFSFWFAPTVLILWLIPSRRGEEFSPDEAENPSRHQPAGTQIITERYQRGFFGKLVSIVFWGWQLLMVLWAISYLSMVGQQYGAGSEAARAGTAFGGTIGISVILWVWLIGAVILGMMMFFTRGEKVIITRTS
ncbi:hypothetical protein [Rhodopila sp.]|uniref:hypothetical protein n=1 Tax=Rhodopila sp. TaxID=2480087 RepID=UPI003D0A90B4